MLFILYNEIVIFRGYFHVIHITDPWTVTAHDLINNLVLSRLITAKALKKCLSPNWIKHLIDPEGKGCNL